MIDFFIATIKWIYHLYIIFVPHGTAPIKVSKTNDEITTFGTVTKQGDGNAARAEPEASKEKNKAIFLMKTILVE